MASRDIKDKMILNFSLLGKITDRGKSVYDGFSNEEVMEITKNNKKPISVAREKLPKENLLLAGNPIPDKKLKRISYLLSVDAYLSEIASTQPNTNKRISLTRARRYNFVEK